MEAFHRERRSGVRFPIRMNLRYRMLHKGLETPSEISGCVLDISSTGILFTPGLNHREGAVVSLSIDWPVLYDDGFPISFSVLGSIVRSDHRGTAVRILRHGFRLFREGARLTEASGTAPLVGNES